MSHFKVDARHTKYDTPKHTTFCNDIRNDTRPLNADMSYCRPFVDYGIAKKIKPVVSHCRVCFSAVRRIICRVQMPFSVCSVVLCVVNRSQSATYDNCYHAQQCYTTYGMISFKFRGILSCLLIFPRNIYHDTRHTKRHRSCDDHIFTLNSFKWNNPNVYTAFIYLRKCFDFIYRKMMLYKLLLLNIRSTEHFIMQLKVCTMYKQTVSCVRLNNQYTEWFDCETGLKQGDFYHRPFFLYSPMIK